MRRIFQYGDKFRRNGSAIAVGERIVQLAQFARLPGMQHVVQLLEFLKDFAHRLFCPQFRFSIHADFHQRAEYIALLLVQRLFAA